MLVNIYASKNKINNLLSVNTRKLALFKLKNQENTLKERIYKLIFLTNLGSIVL